VVAKVVTSKKESGLSDSNILYLRSGHFPEK
jgi:hypothetical protein